MQLDMLFWTRLAVVDCHLKCLFVYPGLLLEHRVDVVTPRQVKWQLSIGYRVFYFLLNTHDIAVFKLHLSVHRTQYEFSINAEEELVHAWGNHPVSGVYACTSLHH